MQKPAVVGIFTGNGELDVYKNGDDSYKFITKGLNVRGSLINSGYDVINIDFENAESIPVDLDVLILSDPKYPYSMDQLQKIGDYIDAGGNMLIAGEPEKQAILNPVINKLGVSFIDGTLLQESENFELDLIQSQSVQQDILPEFKFYEGAVVVSPKAMGITYKDSTDFEITPILISNIKSTWNRLTPFDLNTEKIVFDSINDKRTEVPTAIALKRKINNSKEQKILIVGDADFMSNAQASRNTPRNVNMPLALRAFKWFSNNEYPVSTGRSKSLDTKILVNRDGIFWLKIFLLGIIPLIIAIVGAKILITRHQN